MAAISAASDCQPLIIGKPEGWMFRICLERMQLGVDETASLGDRLETDIAGGSTHRNENDPGLQWSLHGS